MKGLSVSLRALREKGAAQGALSQLLTHREPWLYSSTPHTEIKRSQVLVTCCNRAPYRKQKCGKTDLVSSERLQSIMNKESVEQGCEATDPIASESENREGGVCKLSPPSLF